MNKRNESNSRHLNSAEAKGGQSKPQSQKAALEQRKTVDKAGHRLQGLSESTPDMGSKLGSNPAPFREQIGCQHPNVSLPDATNDWICVDCGDLVDRRSPLQASTPRFLSFAAGSFRS